MELFRTDATRDGRVVAVLDIISEQYFNVGAGYALWLIETVVPLSLGMKDGCQQGQREIFVLHTWINCIRSLRWLFHYRLRWPLPGWSVR